jgi:hypothetical protein
MTNDELYNLVPIGKENAVSLSALEHTTGLTGREIRRTFEELIYDEKPVCNLRHGYFRPATVEELEAYRKYINSYRCKLLKKEYRIRKAMRHFGVCSFTAQPNTPNPEENAL